MVDPSGRGSAGERDVETFVDATIGSFAAWDLVIYLNRNPGVRESLRGLCSVLARSEADLAPAVRRLCDDGVLVEHVGPGAETYALTDDPDVRQLVGRFVTMVSHREHRLEFVRRVLAQFTDG
jgi:hypothetical protein